MADDDEENELGKHFGRLDLDRTGFFDDPPPGPWDGYQPPPRGGGLREGNASGEQMSCSRVGGLLDPQFKRIFVGEADKDDVPPAPTKPGKEDEEEQHAKPVLLRPDYPKKHSTPGDWYGCIGKRLKAFSPETREVPPRERMPPNFFTRPTPFGGPGYADYCINKYVRMYKGYEPYDPEDEVKKPKETPSESAPRRKIFVTTFLPRPYFHEDVYTPMALPPSKVKQTAARKKKPAPMRFRLVFPRAPLGPDNGYFHPFPFFMPDPYGGVQKKKVKKMKKSAPIRVVGVPPYKSKFTESIVDKVTRVACNTVTYADYREQVYPLS